MANREIYSANVNTAPANLKNQSLLPARLFDDYRLLHKRVGVAAGNEIYSIDLLSNLSVANLSFPGFFIVAEV